MTYFTCESRRAIVLWLLGITTYLHFSLFQVNRVFSFAVSLFFDCFSYRKIGVVSFFQDIEWKKVELYGFFGNYS